MNRNRFLFPFLPYRILTGLFALVSVVSCTFLSGGPTGNEQVFTLRPVGSQTLSGTVTLIENSDRSTTFSVSLTNTDPAQTYSVRIFSRTQFDPSLLLFNVGNVAGAVGKMNVTLFEYANGTEFTFTDLKNLDAHVRIYRGTGSGAPVVANADIGSNALTGVSKEYILSEVNGSGMTGKVTLFQRVNNKTLAVVELTGGRANVIHPVLLHNGSLAGGPGSIAEIVADVPGVPGRAFRNLTLANGNAITYEKLIQFNGYINVFKSNTDYSVILARGNMGRNAP